MGGCGESHGALDGYRLPPTAAKMQLQLTRKRLGPVAGVAIRRDANGAGVPVAKAPTSTPRVGVQAETEAEAEALMLKL